MLPARSFVHAMTFGLVALMTGVASATAQEVQWRTDYDGARREARETHRPLILDFGTAGCFWCQRLDDDTFRDPAVVRTMNDRFIPVKIDAGQRQDLVQRLNIHGFPTLVFATAEGRILDYHEGFMDAAAFTVQLSHTIDAGRPRLRVGAKELLARVRDDYRDGLYQGCREKCDALVAAFAGKPEAAEAQTLAARTRDDTSQAARPLQRPTIRAQAP
jgi:thioredoxin-related protein